MEHSTPLQNTTVNVTSTGQWRDFHDRFMQLADNGKPIVMARREDFLSADCEFADPEFDGHCSTLPTLESANIGLRKGQDEHIKARFETLATQAGKALGCPKDVQPLKFWLWSLFVHLRGIKSQYLFAPTQTATIGILTLERAGGIIMDVCKASAIFCAGLENRALHEEEWRCGAGPNEYPNFISRSIPVSRSTVKNTSVEYSPSAPRGQNNRKAAQGAASKSTYAEARGKFCDQVVQEIRRIKNLVVSTGRSVAEIESEYPDFAAWKVRTTLGPEEQETFNHPNRWGPPVGYAKIVLSRTHGVSPHTITSWVKAYRKDQQAKKA